MQDFFDATQIQPQQGGEKHPAGMYDFQITDTYAQQTKDQSGGYLVIEFTSPSGSIVSRYHLWNQNTQAVEIAQKQLSALCHATGIFKLSFPKDATGNMDFKNAARELRGGRGRMEIAPQKNNLDYNEVKKVFDAQGNEPGKAASTPQPQNQQQGWSAPPQNQQPQQAQGWSQGPTVQPANNAAPPSNAPQWGQQQPQQQQPQQQQPQPNANPAPGWQQAPQQGQPQPSAPPWARG